jgi:hypothetical protein
VRGQQQNHVITIIIIIIIIRKCGQTLHHAGLSWKCKVDDDDHVFALHSQRLEQRNIIKLMCVHHHSSPLATSPFPRSHIPPTRTSPSPSTSKVSRPGGLLSCSQEVLVETGG